VRIDRQAEVVQGRFGAAHVMRYRLALDADNLARANALLAGGANG
jgi:hypothetical protein